MQAIILAGGRGERLGSMTFENPKSMIEIGGVPLLEHLVRLAQRHKITEILFTLCYMPDTVKDHFGDGAKLGVRIDYVVEDEPMGTAGGLRLLSPTQRAEITRDSFVVLYGDNLTNFDLTELVSFHRKKRALMTVGLYKNPEPWTGGVVELDGDNKIIALRERPPKQTITTDLSNAGVYVCDPEVIQEIPPGRSDFAYDIIPNLLLMNKPVFGLFDVGAYHQDIGTPERLSKARKDFKNNPLTQRQ